jgi:hypothetical protein
MKVAYSLLVFAALLGSATVSAARGTEDIDDTRIKFSGKLSGTLYVGEDTPAPDIDVCEMSTDRQSELKCSTSDTLGTFDLGNASRGIHVLRLKANGYHTYWYKVKIDAKSKATLRLQITPAS